MSNDKEWSEWFEHDGKGCPCKGMWVKTETGAGDVEEHIAGGLLIFDPRGNVDASCDLWDYATLLSGDWPDRIIRYRIRRPRALLQLIEMVENLPAPAQPRVDA